MQYPKQQMKIKELIALGFSKEMLMNAYRSRGQRFAQKMSPGRKTSPIIFDTEEFEKWRMEQLVLENKSLHR